MNYLTMLERHQLLDLMSQPDSPDKTANVLLLVNKIVAMHVAETQRLFTGSIQQDIRRLQDES